MIGTDGSSTRVPTISIIEGFEKRRMALYKGFIWIRGDSKEPVQEDTKRTIKNITRTLQQKQLGTRQ